MTKIVTIHLLDIDLLDIDLLLRYLKLYIPGIFLNDISNFIIISKLRTIFSQMNNNFGSFFDTLSFSNIVSTCKNFVNFKCFYELQGAGLGLTPLLQLRVGLAAGIAIFFPGISRNSSQFSRYFPGYVLTDLRSRQTGKHHVGRGI